MNVLDFPATLDHDLDWQSQKKLAKQAFERGEQFFCQFDFGLSSSLSLYEPSYFQSFALAIKHFIDHFWSPYKDSISGISLFEGSLDFLLKNEWKEEYRDNFSEWLESETSLDPFLIQNHIRDATEWEQHLYSLFKINVFAGYLHRLASHFPDAIQPICSFDVSSLSHPGVIAQFLSKARFEHLLLRVTGTSLPLNEINGVKPNLGVVLPPDGLCDLSVLEELEKIFEALECQKTPFRIIPEVFLTEQWDGVDTLIVIEKGLSAQGKRKLQGFSAAGGKVDCLTAFKTLHSQLNNRAY